MNTVIAEANYLEVLWRAKDGSRAQRMQVLKQLAEVVLPLDPALDYAALRAEALPRDMEPWCFACGETRRTLHQRMRESYLLRAAREHGSGPSELPGNREMVGKGGPKWSPLAIESKPKPKKRNPAIAKMCPCSRHMITASQVEHRIATCWKCREEIRLNAKAQVRASR